MLQDYTGPLPAYGAQGTTGFYSGLAYKADDDPLGSDAVDEGDYEYSVGDIDLEILARDTQFAAGQAQELATALVQQEDVDMLYGVGNSGGSVRIINTVVDRAEVPFIMGPSASAGITNSSETCRDLVFRANENTAMDARSGGQYIANETDVESIALFGADDEFGRAVVGNYGDVLRANGIDIPMERYVPSGHAEWEGLLSEAAQQADGMVGGFTASTLIPMARTFLTQQPDIRLFGGFASRVTLGPVASVMQDVLGGLDTDQIDSAQFGPFTTRYHWNQWDNDINDSFVDMHTDAYEVVPDLFTSGAFTAASSVIQAMQEGGEVSADAVVENLRGMTVTDTPKGENGYEYQLFNNQAKSAMTIADVIPTKDEWADVWPAGIQPSEPVATIGADDVVNKPDDEGVSCDLR